MTATRKPELNRWLDWLHVFLPGLLGRGPSSFLFSDCGAGAAVAANSSGERDGTPVLGCGGADRFLCLGQSEGLSLRVRASRLL